MQWEINVQWRVDYDEAQSQRLKNNFIKSKYGTWAFSWRICSGLYLKDLYHPNVPFYFC